LPVHAEGIDYALKIQEIINTRKYANLRTNSRKRYDELLNWDSAGQRVKGMVNERFY